MANITEGEKIKLLENLTWETAVRICIEGLLNGTTEGKELAREELLDMGRKLDQISHTSAVDRLEAGS